jgi:hypothetical protein
MVPCQQCWSNEESDCPCTGDAEQANGPKKTGSRRSRRRPDEPQPEEHGNINGTDQPRTDLQTP